MKLGRCGAPALCGAILTVWILGASSTRAQTAAGSADVNLPIQNAAGLRLLVATEHSSPVLSVVLPGLPTSDRSIEILFPEHVTVVQQGQPSGASSSICSVPAGEVATERCGVGSGDFLEYERDLPGRDPPARARHAGGRRRALPL